MYAFCAKVGPPAAVELASVSDWETYAVAAPTLQAAQIWPFQRMISAPSHPGYRSLWVVPAETLASDPVMAPSTTAHVVLRSGSRTRPLTPPDADSDMEGAGKFPVTAAFPVEGTTPAT